MKVGLLKVIAFVVTSFLLVTVAAANTDSYVDGCIVAQINGADTGSGVAASVAVIGRCTGSGCDGSEFGGVYETNSGGLLIIDSRDENRMWEPVEGPGTGLYVFVLADGYHPLTLYHEPNWVYSSAHDRWYTMIDDVWLARETDVDTDGDGLYDSQEVRLGTSSTNSDTDGDGLSDFAEVYGYNWIDLRAKGVSPTRKDLLVECDYYEGYRPLDDAINDVVDAFANAPVSNPDGSSGVNLIVDIDQEIEANDAPGILDLTTSDWTDYTAIRGEYFSVLREGVYRYCVWAAKYDSGEERPSTNSTGLATFNSDRFVITNLPTGSGGSTVRIKQAGTFMHEIGHTLGLTHSFYPPKAANERAGSYGYQPNYFSVMSYFHQLAGLAYRSDPSQPFVDFARSSAPSLFEGVLIEALGFMSAVPSLFVPKVAYDVGASVPARVVVATSGDGVDFSRDGIVSAGIVSADIDGDGAVGVIPAASEDWSRLDYAGGNRISTPVSGAGASSSTILRNASRSLLQQVGTVTLTSAVVDDMRSNIHFELQERRRARQAQLVTAATDSTPCAPAP